MTDSTLRPASADQSHSSGQPTVVAQGLSKRFGAVHAVRDLSFEVPERCVCGLLGPNGAGKTTTIRMLAGLLVPDRGTLTIAGIDTQAEPAEVRKRIGYLPESAPVHPELRTSEFLRYRAELIGLTGAKRHAAIERVVAACDLGPVVGRLVGALSKGYRQRVGLAAAILGDPKLVILDEPSVGLDPNQMLAFRALLRSLGRERTVLLSSHILTEVEAVCDRAILLAQGELVAHASIDELRQTRGDRYIVEARSDRPGAVRDAVASVAHLGGLAEEALRDGWVRITADAAADADPAAVGDALAMALSNAGAVPREIHRERATLESLFLHALRSKAATARGANR